MFIDTISAPRVLVCFFLMAMLLFASVEYFLTKQCWRSLGNIRPGPKGWNRIFLFTYAKNWMVFFKSNFRIPPFSFDIDFKQHCFSIDKTLTSSGFYKKAILGDEGKVMVWKLSSNSTEVLMEVMQKLIPKNWSRVAQSAPN